MISNDLIEIPIVYDHNENERVGSVIIHQKYLQHLKNWIIQANKPVIEGDKVMLNMSLIPNPEVVKVWKEQLKQKPCKCKRKLL